MLGSEGVWPRLGSEATPPLYARHPPGLTLPLRSPHFKNLQYTSPVKRIMILSFELFGQQNILLGRWLPGSAASFSIIFRFINSTKYKFRQPRLSELLLSAQVAFVLPRGHLACSPWVCCLSISSSNALSVYSAEQFHAGLNESESDCCFSPACRPCRGVAAERKSFSLRSPRSRIT